MGQSIYAENNDLIALKQDGLMGVLRSKTSAKAGLPRGLARVRQANLGWILALSVSLFAGTTQGLEEVLGEESDAPIEQTESTPLLALVTSCSLRRSEPACRSIDAAMVSAAAPRRTAIRRLSADLAGHRLLNGLCAPLRC